MGRRLVLAAVAAAALGATAPAASARCAHENPVVCAVTCQAARLAGAQCKQ